MRPADWPLHSMMMHRETESTIYLHHFSFSRPLFPSPAVSSLFFFSATVTTPCPVFCRSFAVYRNARVNLPRVVTHDRRTTRCNKLVNFFSQRSSKFPLMTLRSMRLTREIASQVNFTKQLHFFSTIYSNYSEKILFRCN